VAEDFRARERGLGFAATARAAGALCRRITAPAGDAFDAGRAALAELVANRHVAVTAAAFANDPLACGALLEARARGLGVPGDIALLGFGDFALGRQLQPTLSTVHPPRHEIGREAARAVLAALARGAPPVGAALPWSLIERGSTAAPAV
jgi:LacI family gluconate utilization system Gnt-I transcriptional repressor